MIEGSIGTWGLIIIEDHNLVIQKGMKKVKKTFKERLCIRFWEVYKEVPNMIPDPEPIKVGNQIIIHPETLIELKRLVEEQEVLK